MNLDNVKLITHKDCHDGSACAILFVACGGLIENVVFTHPNHNDVDDVAEHAYYNWEGPIWFVDVSVSEKTAELLANRGDVLLIDHHKSAIPLTRFSFCNVDKFNSACGSKLFFEFLRKEFGPEIRKYRELVDMVDDIDRWVRQIPDSDSITRLHSVLGQKGFIKRFSKKPQISFSQIEKFLIEMDMTREKEYVESKKTQVVKVNKIIGDKEITIGFVSGGGPYRSVLGDALCTDPSLGIDLAVMINGDFISLRSRNGEIDCARIAENNGAGGGHAAAAGCNLSKILGKDLVTLAIENMKFE